MAFSKLFFNFDAILEFQRLTKPESQTEIFFLISALCAFYIY